MWGKRQLVFRPFGVWEFACSAYRRNSRRWDSTTHPTHPTLAETFAPPLRPLQPPPNKGSSEGSRQLQIQRLDTYCPRLDVKRLRLKDPSFDFAQNCRHRSGSLPGAVPSCTGRPRPRPGAWAGRAGGRASPSPQAFAPGSPSGREGPHPPLLPPPPPQRAGCLSPSRSRLSGSLAAALGAAGTGRSGLCPRSARHCSERTVTLAPSAAHSGSPAASARAR